MRLRVNPQNAGPAPRIHYAEDAPVSESSPQLKDQTVHHVGSTRELPGVRPIRSVRDWRSGDLDQQACPPEPAYVRRTESARSSCLSPRKGDIRYSLDGREPRDGTPYDRPIPIGDGEVLLRAFAEADGIETKKDFHFPAKGKKGVQIDEVKPGISSPAPVASSIRVPRRLRD